MWGERTYGSGTSANDDRNNLHIFQLLQFSFVAITISYSSPRLDKLMVDKKKI